MEPMSNPKEQNYPPKSAGSICETNVARITTGMKVSELSELLSRHSHDYTTLDYVYIESVRGELIGILPLKKVFPIESASVDDIMTREVISIDPQADQERIVRLALEKNLKSMPVVADGKLIGVVPPHRILRILHEEHVEDLLKVAGVVQESMGESGGYWHQVKSRLPWLLYGTLGGLLAAAIVHQFETALAERLLLAAFIPTIVYLADAVGNQVQTLYVRAYAFGLSRRLRTSIARELRVVATIGVSISLLLGSVIMLWFGQGLVAAIVALATLIAVTFAGLVAVIMPWLFIKLRFDPAVASGPLGTIVLDLSSILVYFLVAEFMLHRFA